MERVIADITMYIAENLLQKIGKYDKINIYIYERKQKYECFGIGKCDKE